MMTREWRITLHAYHGALPSTQIVHSIYLLLFLIDKTISSYEWLENFDYCNSLN